MRDPGNEVAKAGFHKHISKNMLNIFATCLIVAKRISLKGALLFPLLFG